MIEIRRITSGQADVFRAVRLTALPDAPHAFGSALEREAAFDDQVWTDRAGAAAIGNGQALFLAWLDGRPVGIAGGHRPDGDPTVAEVELISMWTDPSVRRSGAGRSLVEAVVGWATDTGAHRVALWVTQGNDPARLLYERMGFTVTGDHQPLPSDPCKDEIRMIRPIG
jgi:GNAT superfamily N-acetyltransferase